MPITTEEGRTEIIEGLVGAVAELEKAMAALGEAYEHLAVTSADRLEGELFRPAQLALGRAKRTLAGFTERAGLSAPQVAPGEATGPRSQGARGYIDQAVIAAETADLRLAGLQDSGRPVEFGDAELRAGLTEIRGALEPLPRAAREFTRTLGR